MDKADGSGTLLFDAAPRATGRSDVLEALEIPRGWLPPTFEGPEVTGTVTAEAAAETGPPSGRRWWRAAATRRPARSARARCGRASCRSRLGHVRRDLRHHGARRSSSREGRLHAFCHAVPGKLALHGRDALGGGQPAVVPRHPGCRRTSFDALVAEAETAPAGSEGLLFLPYLSGERTPYPDPLARGTLRGPDPAALAART